MLVLNPFSKIIARTPGVQATAKALNVSGDFLAKEVGGRAILPFIDKSVFLKSFQAKLPPFKKWQTFSVTDSNPLKVALKESR
jgi:hypothetical protein